MEAQPPFEHIYSELSRESVPLDHQKYMTPFLDHKEGDDICLNPRSILRMRTERADVAWKELTFKKEHRATLLLPNG